MIRIFKPLLACAAALAAAPAQAAWTRAESTHFIIYADKSPEALRAFATKLERFDDAVRVARMMNDVPPGPTNRLTVFVLQDVDAIQALIGAPGSGIAGFYIPRFSGSVAFVPDDTKDVGSESFTPQTVFFHEYSHHLMMQSLDQVLPKWLVEGFAEFYSTAKFEPDGSVGFGIAPAHRGFGINYLEGLPLKNMLTGHFVERAETEELLYGRGWLLTHYLAFDHQRSGQLTKYVQGITDGLDPLDAAKQAFGDLDQLSRELDEYRKQKRLEYALVPASKLKSATVNIFPVSAGEAAIMPLRIRTACGLARSSTRGVADAAEKIATAFPNDPAVWTEVAEAEFDAEQYESARTAADKAIALDGKAIKPLILKGLAEEKLAAKNPKTAAWAQIRSNFLAANRADPDAPAPLVDFYKSFEAAGQPPTKNAVAGLYYAATLVPQDDKLRLIVANQLLTDSLLPQARRELAPVAFDPHGGKLGKEAETVIDQINKGDRAAALTALAKLIHDEEKS